MNKKYMDFVPVTAAKKVKKQPVKAVPADVRNAKPVAESKQPSLNELDKKKTELKLPPKPAFVNTEKVRKRPLSKNVYQKPVVVPKEEPSSPVTIINKPEKDSKIGLVVTIIITIILGAAAGTVAFLLLPK